MHLLAGLPTAAVRRAFEQAGEAMTVVPLDALADLVVGDADRLGVLLPPFVEPSQIVESWEECDFLPYRFGRPARVAGVSTFLDVGHLDEQLASAETLSLHDWGRCDLDGRTVADIVVGQIESATHLVLVGSRCPAPSLARRLDVLNPTARRIPLHGGGHRDASGLAALLGRDDGVAPDRGASPDRSPAPEDHGARVPARRSARVVPPWRALLEEACRPAPGAGPVVYRRARPFAPGRLSDWLEDPPGALVRGKGHVWLAGEPDRRFGYSCAGSVHRLFPAGRWWASYGGDAWPSCPTSRRRLFERWHPRFGDRRQELVFVGVDLDPEQLCAGLDACLATDEAFEDASLDASRGGSSMPPASRRARLH